MKGDTTLTIQAIRFDKTIFTPETARKWLNEHNFIAKKFEEAENTGEDIDNIQINNQIEFKSKHNATLQRLDVHIPFYNTELVPSGRMFYTIDAFKGTESEWNNTPLIFIPKGNDAKHPDHNEVKTNPESAASQVNGYVAGYITNAKVYDGSNGTGEPRLEADMVFTCPKADALANEGKLSLSTGFNASFQNTEKAGIIKGKVIPNHTLLFERGACPTCYANDNGATLNNTICKICNDNIELDNVVPPHTLKYGLDFTGRWRAPTLMDFTDKKRLSELSEDKRRDIAAHFAYSGELPPLRFTDLKLAHHNPKKTGLGDANRNGVIAAMNAIKGARGGVNIPEEDKRRAYNHLREHRIEMGDDKEDLPTFDNIISGEYEMTEEINEVTFDKETKGFFKTMSEGISKLLEKDVDVKNTIETSDAGEIAPEEKIDMAEIDNLKSDLSSKVAEIDNLKSEMATKDEKITELDNTIADLQAKIEANEAEKIQAAKDAKWAEVKNTVPAGWLEDESKTREEFESDPVMFASKLIEHNNSVEIKTSEGSESIAADPGKSKGMITKYNYAKGVWEE